MVAAERATCRVRTLDTLIQQLINGVMLGSIYALIALGYTMVYGILRIINFAHGDILMVGALTTLSAINVLNNTFPHLPLLLQLGFALLVAMAVCALLALDEPAAGMNAAEKVALGELLTRIRDDGRTLLMIEHDVKLVMGICDRLTVLDYGKTLASGTPESVRRDPAVIAAWLGGNAHV